MALQTSVAEQSALTRFFTAARFAVVGASADRAKYGNKVLRWYLERELPVTAVHPKAARIEECVTEADLGKVLDAAGSTLEATTSVSVITPPTVSLELLRKYGGDPRVVAFWLQPGAADATVCACDA